MSIPQGDPYADLVWDPDELAPPSEYEEPPFFDGHPAAAGGSATGTALRQAQRPAAATGVAASRFATAAEALHTVFGYEQFRGNQADAIEQLVSGGDAVAA